MDGVGEPKSRAKSDLVWVAAFVVVVAYLAFVFDIFEQFARITKNIGQADEIFTVMTFLPLALAVYAWRRWKELAAEHQRSTSSESALRQAETKFHNLFDRTPIGMFQSTPEGGFLAINKAVATMFGFDSPEEMMAARSDVTMQGYVHPEDRLRFVRLMLEQNAVVRFKYEAYRKEKTTIWVSEEAHTVRNQLGEVLYYEGSITDITEKVLAQQRLLKSEEKYRALFQQIPEPMWIYDLDTLSFLDVNDASIQHYGYSRDEFLSMTLKDIRPPDDLPQLMQGLPEVTECTVFRHKKKNGVVFSAEIREQRITFGTGTAGLILATDISEKLALEQQLRQGQKMEAIGNLTGGIAHDFNNLLMVITSYCDLLNERSRADEASDRYISQIRQASNRAAEITRQLLAFSRKQVLVPRVVDFNSVMQESVGLLKRLLGEHIRLVFSPGENLWPIKADPSQLCQVLMNLAVNARDAMPLGGELVVQTANIELDEEYCMGHQPVPPGRYVVLSIRDTGQGMDANTQKQIFEPFFTTKPVGKGTGLGLSTVYGIVKQSGGYVWVYSELNLGTVFKIYLPYTGIALNGNEQVKPDQSPTQGSATLLLVEDEEALANVEADFLRKCGYTVLLARDSKEALQIANQEHAGPIDLLVSDVVLPGTSGRELSKTLQKSRPHMGVVFMSGYTTDTALLQDIAEGEYFLQKPFALSALANKIHQALASSHTAI